MKSLVFGSFFMICFTSTLAITCYNCQYFSGHPLSQAHCESNPGSADAYDCNAAREGNSTLFSQIVKGLNKSNETNLVSGSIDQKQYVIACSKYTGQIQNRNIVVRSCEPVPNEYSRTCTNEAFIAIDGTYADNVRACFCTGDRCNGASSLQLGYFSLFAIAIHILYKLKN